MANTVKQGGNPKAKEIYDKYMSGDNKDKVYIPESDYYSSENIERRRQAQDKINSMPEFGYPETPSFKENHPDKTMDEYLNSMNPDGRNAAIPLNQDKISLGSLSGDNTATNGGQTAGSTVPENTQTNATNDGTIKVGPQNANLNYYQYGDDSNPAQQGQRGGMNEKYTGEGVSNTYIEYNPDITLADLDPNYLYGENARQQNRKEAGYIARRNDMIASALYNEGKVSKEDVAEFLSQQNEWMNSTEADRLNTIESVWKRLGQMQPKEEPQADFNKDTSGKIYGKTTAEEGNPREGIDTLEDDNSVFNAINATRVKTTDDMYNVGVDNLAATKYYNTGAYSEQNWRDFSLRYPETAALVEQKVKEMKAQDTVNAVSNGTDLPSNTNTVGAVNNNIADFSNANATSTTSSAQITKNINTMLDNNQTAQTAQELMGTLEGEMATLKNRLKNLREEANSKFKGDAPDYLVNAYMNNKSQEIQNQLSIIEDRYNAAYKRYTTEVSQAQWQQEFDLKKKQLEMDEKEFELKKWATEQGVEIDWYKAKGTTSTSNSGRELPVTTKTRDEIGGIVDNLVDMVNNGKAGNAQCAAGIQKYYFPELGISIGGLSKFEDKKGLINTDKYYVPKKGDLVIIDSGAKLEDGTNAGHIGIVVSVDGDTLTYLDWNGDGKETAKVRTTSINNKKIAGYYDVTKGQSSTYSSGKWTDEDYSNFESFLDTDKETRMNKTDKEAMAAEYGTDLEGMRILATEALAARNNTVNTTVNTTDNGTVSINEEGRTVITPTDGGEPIVYAEGVTVNDPRINQTGFNPELGFNEYTAEFYEEVNKEPSKYTKKEQEEARNYAKAVSDGTFGDKDKKTSYTKSLLDNIAQLYYLGRDKDGTLNFNGTAWYTNSPMNLKYKTIKSAMTLNEMLNAKANNVGFGQVTEYEWEMLKAAASALGNSFWEKDADIDYEFKNNILPVIWHDVFGQDNDFSDEKWEKYINGANRPKSKNIGATDVLNNAKYLNYTTYITEGVPYIVNKAKGGDFDFDALFDFNDRK